MSSAGRVQQVDVEVADVLDVDVRPLLAAPEHGDPAARHRRPGQDVDGQVQPQARRVAADGRRADDHRGEVGRLMLEEERLAEALVLVVVGERDERMLLGDLRRVADPVDARGRGVDEAAHSRVRAATTSGSKQSKLMERLSSGSSSKLGSFEMHARWMTMSCPGRARSSRARSRISPLIRARAGDAAGRWSPKRKRSRTRDRVAGFEQAAARAPRPRSPRRR